ncbi:MAG: c-type cytochrome [Solirubrobacteraceae bacterium]
MRRPARVLVLTLAAIAVAGLTAACGTEKISVAKSAPTYQGAVLFSQRCAGCHTLSYAATHGSAANIRTAEAINGPNFNVRCERPIARVLYAIENGGFSGAYMPQNIVVGSDAIKVAEFVSEYAGRQAATGPGGTPCVQQPEGQLPAPSSTASAAQKTTTSTPLTPQTPTTAASAPLHKKSARGAKRRPHKRTQRRPHKRTQRRPHKPTQRR